MQRSLRRLFLVAFVIAATLVASQYRFPQLDHLHAQEVPSETPATIPPLAGTPVSLATATIESASSTFAAGSPTPTATDLSGISNTPVPATPDTTTTPNPTSTGSPTDTPTPVATPTVDPTLPDLTSTPEDVGTVDESVVDNAPGGRIASRDGRIVVDFPAGFASEPVDVTVTKVNLYDFTPPSPDRPFVSVWRFDAMSVASQTEVHQFLKDLRFTIRFTENDVAGLDTRNLVFWTLDEASQSWQPVTGSVDWKSATLVATANHFSIDSATASMNVDVAPLLDGRHTDLHTGAASFSFPIELPPGRGGLAPDLTLSYNSGRLAEMRGFASLSSWLGEGWDVDTPNIQIAQDPGTVPPTNRVFLSIGALGGEIMQDSAGTADSDGYIWRARDEQYLKIRSNVQSVNGAVWTVWTKDGTKYVFGGGTETSNFRRFTKDAPTGITRDYRADVNSVQDRYGNQIIYAYSQDRRDLGLGQYVRAAYPSTITYNGGATVVYFFTGSRIDTPHDVTDAVCGQESPPLPTTYFAPPAFETSKLDGIQIDNAGGVLREYDFQYDQTAFGWFDHNWNNSCPPVGLAGRLMLRSITLRDRNLQSFPYTTTHFSYTGEHHAYYDATSHVKWEYSWDHLTEADNAFGGKDIFTYEEKGQPVTGPHWSREVVTHERHQFGANQPDIATTNAYLSDPQQWTHPNPYLYKANPAYIDYFLAEWRGFTNVRETDDASGNTIDHYYQPTGALQSDAISGREWYTLWRDIHGATWRQVSTTWTLRPVNNQFDTWDWFTNSTVETQVVTTLRDNTALTVLDTYDDGMTCLTSGVGPCYGLLTQVDDTGEPGTGDHILAKTAYQKNVAAGRWLFLPSYQEKLDVDFGNALISCARNYYDGANDATSPPNLGLVTAKSTAITATSAQCEGNTAFTNSTNTYSIYETYDSPRKTYGNVANASIPTFVAPESLSPGDAFGWIPGLASSHVDYDPTFHLFPITQSNPLSQPITSTYDYVLGKPLTVAGPNGNVTHKVYDDLGRIARSYDNSDSDTSPSVRYTYGWGSVPNTTLTERKYTDTFYATSLSCADGYGREYDTRTLYGFTSRSSVRTDYDASGNKAVQTNPVNVGSNGTCSSTPTAVTTRDRTAYTYDPLGNVIKTMAIAANQSSGPYTQADYNGKTTTKTDELLHQTTEVRSFSGRTLSVTQASSSTLDHYDASNNLIDVTDPAGNKTTIVYDLAGEKTSMNDRDMGVWSYTYYANGKLNTQIDAQIPSHLVTTLNYDAMARLTMKSFSNGAPSTTFTYDSYPDTSYCTEAGATAIGQMTHMTDAAGEQLSCFDIRAREEKTRRALTGDPNNYDITRGFDPLGHITDLTYPDGELVHSVYDTGGTLTSMCQWDSVLHACNGTTYVTNTVRTPSLAPASLQLGDGQTTTYQYDFRQRLHVLQTGTVQNLTFTYDDASNITGVNDTVNGENVTYGYDSLNRLTSASGFSGGGEAAYTYDATGNMLMKLEGDSNLTLCYPTQGASSVHPHAVVSLYSGAGTCGISSPTQTFAYYPNGGLVGTSLPNCVSPCATAGHDFDAEGHVSVVLDSTSSSTTTGFKCVDEDGNGAISLADVLSVVSLVGKTRASAGWDFRKDLNWSNAVTNSDSLIELNAVGTLCPAVLDQYAYDGNGVMVKRTHSGSTPLATSWTAYIGGIYEITNSGVVTKYYSASGRHIAMRSSGTLTYLLADQLGSTVGLLDTAGVLVPGSATLYWPYGGSRMGPTSLSDKLFTGQQKEPTDPVLSLYNYRARFYSTVTGRFLEPDPTHDSLNRYAYVNNNPLNAIDPSGLSGLFVCGWHQDCQNGGHGFSEYESQVTAYWATKGITFGALSYGAAFNLLWYVVAAGWDSSQTLAAFQVGFMNTDPNPSEGPIGDFYHASGWSENQALWWSAAIENTVASHSDIDFLFGFSLGGRAVAEFLYEQGNRNYYHWLSPDSFTDSNIYVGRQIKGAVLADPFMDSFIFGRDILGRYFSGLLGPLELQASLLPGTHVVIRNDDLDVFAHGHIEGGYEFSDRGCDGYAGNHCTHPLTAQMDVSLALAP